jgi:hypothetical protein
MDLAVVHDVHMTINLVHRLVYFVPEAEVEYAALGVGARSGYFASRSAPMGPVPPEVIIATFYNFSPAAVTTAMAGVREAATPESFQAARFRVVQRSLERVAPALSRDDISEARSLVDPVVAGLELGGRPLAAANAAVTLPDDPLVALWQQIAAIGSLRARGWAGDDGSLTAAGRAAREALEADTDRLCAPIWSVIGDQGASRLAELIRPIHTAMDAAGTYAAFA